MLIMLDLKWQYFEKYSRYEYFNGTIGYIKKPGCTLTVER